MVDDTSKSEFREGECSIVEFYENKTPVINSGSHNLKPLQSDVEFSKLSNTTRWGVTQSPDSNVLIFDQDDKSNNPKLNRLFNRSRRSFKKGEFINSKHGFVQVTDATHEDCVRFAKEFHTPGGLEIFAEKQNVIFAGMYDAKKDRDLDDGEEMPHSTWSNTDDSVTSAIIKMTKKELGEIFVGYRKLGNSPRINNNSTVPAGEGVRHNEILSEVMVICKKLNKDNESINFEKVFRSLTELKVIDRMSDYENGSSKAELEQMITWAVEEVNTKGADFGKEFMESKSDEYFAHIEDMPDEFNCWFWNSKKWSPNTAHHILERLEGLHTVDFIPTDALAKTIKSKISASSKTLKINPSSPEYLKKIHSVITNIHGQYYDLKTGEIKDVDASEFFFTSPQIELKFNESETSELFLEFLDERYSKKDKDILIDHLAGGFIHVRDIGAKTKILYNQGEHDTWKSVIIEIMEGMLVNQQYSEQSFEHISKSNFGKSLIANKLWNFQEEIKSGRIDDVTVVKEIITAEDGKCEFKNGRDEQYITRYPRHFFTANKIQPISKDDDDGSIFVRNQYIQSLNVEAKYDWREKLKNPEELQKILMFLLHRAHIIYSKQDKIKMQTEDETKKRYSELVQGSILKFIKNWCLTKGIQNTIGTSYVWLLTKYNEENEDTVSSKAFTLMLEELGLEKYVQKWVYLTNKQNVFTEIKENGISEDKVQKTVVMGITPNYDTKSATNINHTEKITKLSMTDNT